MPRTLHVRNVPDDVHSTLVLRAEVRGMSLRRYTITVLREHCALPALDDWLSGLEELTPVRAAVSGAEAVERGREADDRKIEHARNRR